MKNLLRKGQKTVINYMKRNGYQLYDVYETEDGYKAEYYKTVAGITTDCVFIHFNNKNRVIKIENAWAKSSGIF